MQLTEAATLDRKSGEAEDLQFRGLSWKCFSTQRTLSPECLRAQQILPLNPHRLQRFKKTNHRFKITLR
jgi:hypothetical protein